MQTADTQSGDKMTGACRRRWSLPRVLEGREMLQDFACFQELEPSVQAELPGVTRLVTKRQGSVLFREGDSPECCYIIVSGRVTLWEAESDASVDDGRGSMSRSSPPCSSACSTPCSTTASASLRSSSSGPSSRPSSGPASQPSSRPMSHQSSRAASPRDVISKVAKKLSCTASSAVTAKGDCQSDSDGLGHKSVTLGPGRVLGHLALLRDGLRSFTAACKHDCELLVIDKPDFDRLLKPAMQSLTQEKMDFLKKYLPGMKDLPEHRAEPLLHRFQTKVFQKGDLVYAQGSTAKRCLFIVSKGSVFVTCHAGGTAVMLPEARGTLVRGDLFGSLGERAMQPCTVMCTSTCEVLLAEHHDLFALPSCIRRSTHSRLFQTETFPLAPTRSGRPGSGRWDRLPQFTDISAQSRRRWDESDQAGASLKQGTVESEATKWQPGAKSPERDSQAQDCVDTGPSRSLRRANAGASSLPLMPKKAWPSPTAASRRQKSQTYLRAVR